MASNTQEIKDAERNLKAAQGALAELDRLFEAQRAKVGELEKAAGQSLADAPLSDLVNQAGQIAASGAAISAARAVLAELDRRRGVQREAVAAADKALRLEKARDLANEAWQAEADVMGLVDDLAAKFERIKALNEAIYVETLCTRQQAFSKYAREVGDTLHQNFAQHRQMFKKPSDTLLGG
jgi:hypothetical protein